MEKYGQLILYKKNNGKKDIEVKLYNETVWLNQNQLVDLFESSKANISEHINHIFQEEELIFDKSDKFIQKWIKDNKKEYNKKQEIFRFLELYNKYRDDENKIVAHMNRF